jgi:hypothetical protein
MSVDTFIVLFFFKKKEKAGSKMMKDFVMACQDNDDIANLKKEVETFATTFPMPGTIYLFFIKRIKTALLISVFIGFDPSNLTNLTSSE